jgi:hypothetical protein
LIFLHSLHIADPSLVYHPRTAWVNSLTALLHTIMLSTHGQPEPPTASPDSNPTCKRIRRRSPSESPGVHGRQPNVQHCEQQGFLGIRVPRMMFSLAVQYLLSTSHFSPPFHPFTDPFFPSSFFSAVIDCVVHHDICNQLRGLLVNLLSC